jgi:hypothetical protein
MSSPPNMSRAEEDPAIHADQSANVPRGVRSGRSSQFTSAVTSFAEMVAPRRRIIRDPYYGATPADPERRPMREVRLTKAEWIMIVVAGAALGTALAFLFAGV